MQIPPNVQNSQTAGAEAVVLTLQQQQLPVIMQQQVEGGEVAFH